MWMWLIILILNSLLVYLICLSKMPQVSNFLQELLLMYKICGLIRDSIWENMVHLDVGYAAWSRLISSSKKWYPSGTGDDALLPNMQSCSCSACHQESYINICSEVTLSLHNLMEDNNADATCIYKISSAIL